MKLGQLISKLNHRYSSLDNFLNKSGQKSYDWNDDAGYNRATKEELEFLDDILKEIESENIECSCGKINFGFERR